MRKLKCAAFAHNLERNGSELVLYSIVKALRNKFNFEIFTPIDGPLSERYKSLNIPVHVIKMDIKNYKDTLRNKVNGYDLAIVNTIIRSEATVIVSELKIPSLWIIHETWPIADLERMMSGIWKWEWPTKNTILDAFNKCQKVIFPADATQKCYEDILQNNKSHVIYNGLDIKRIDLYKLNKSKLKIREKLGYDQNTIVLLQIGSINRRKAQKDTILALMQLKEEYADKEIKLLIVGERNIREHEITYTNELKRYIYKSKLSKDVKILPAQDNVYQFYHAADALICPSLSEVLPMVILEAMAFELPVIASKIDGIPEAINDGIEGIMVQPSNPDDLSWAIKKIIDNESLRKRIGSCGYQRLKNQFDFNRMIKEYQEIIDNLKMN
jgi:glycosyltransferase involved in cell wall biosynthesis